MNTLAIASLPVHEHSIFPLEIKSDQVLSILSIFYT